MTVPSDMDADLPAGQGRSGVRGPILGERDRAWQRLGSMCLAAQMALLAALVVAVSLLLAPCGYALRGEAGLISVGVAAGIALVAAELALIGGWMCTGPAAVMYGMLVGMSARMIVALLVGVPLQLGVRPLAEGAMILFLVVFYLLTLAVETVLLVARIRPATVQPKVM
jgi:hypothetical protein